MLLAEVMLLFIKDCVDERSVLWLFIWRFAEWPLRFDAIERAELEMSIPRSWFDSL